MLNLGAIFYQLGVDTSGLNKASKKVKFFNQKSRNEFNRTQNSVNQLRNALGILITTETIRRTVMFTNEYTALRSRLEAVVGETLVAEKAFARLEKTAGITGATVSTAISGFQKLFLAKDTVNATTQEMLTLTDTFLKMGAISKTNAELMDSAMLQFSQGLATGVFQAQEFQSVAENIPGISAEIAKGMGITNEQLIKLKKEGMLVSSQVFRALLNRADAINEKFQGIDMDVSRGANRFVLGMQKALGKADDALGVTKKIGETLFQAGVKIEGFSAHLIAAAETIKKIVNENKKILQIAGSILAIKGAIVGVNAALAVTSAIVASLVTALGAVTSAILGVNAAMTVTAGLLSFLGTKSNVFVLLASKALDFGAEIIATTIAAQGLLKALDKLTSLDFKGASEEIQKIPDVYREALDTIKAQNDIDSLDFKGFMDGFLDTFDPAKLDIVQEFNAQLLKAQEDLINQQQQLNNVSLEGEKQTEAEKAKLARRTYLERLGVIAWFHKSKSAFSKASNKTELDSAKKGFNEQLQAASEHSKQFAALTKALALFDLLVKTPQAIGAAFTYGNAVGGPVVGSLFAGVAGAAMGAQVAAVTSANYTPRAVGGDVFPNQIYQVNENGPEMFSFGGKDFLATGNSRGHIEPAGSFTSSGASLPPTVNINIQTPTGQTANVKQTNNQFGGFDIDVIIEQVDSRQAEGIFNGTSQTSRALESTFGLNRGARAVL